MPLLKYFGWVGSFLLAALLAVNGWFPAPSAPLPASDVPLNQRVNIRIHTNHKWPDRVVFDTGRSTLMDEAKANAETDIGGSETPVPAERQLFDAFAEMAAIPARPCFRPPCSVGQTVEREASPIEKGALSQKRLRTTARKDLTFPNPLHKPPGRS